ncbi:discoidin domain-containing protein [Lentisphaerota bacterium WC36G]|nr:discoidin domain-containing protein [Lentisphaerae bacterium WC36]
MLNTKKTYQKLTMSLSLLGLSTVLLAQNNTVFAEIKSAKGNSELQNYSAEKAVDNVVSDKSRWINQRNEKGHPEIVLNLKKKQLVRGIHLYSGFGHKDAVKDFVVYYKDVNSNWKKVKDIRNNSKTALAVPFKRAVNTAELKIVFTKTKENLARIKEIKVIKNLQGKFPAIDDLKAKIKVKYKYESLWNDSKRFPSDQIVLDSIVNIPFITGDFQLHVSMKNFQFSVSDSDGEIVIPSHKISGLYFSGGKAMTGRLLNADREKGIAVFKVKNSVNKIAKVTVLTNDENVIKFTVETDDNSRIVLNAGVDGVAHGLGDSGGFHEKFDLTSRRRVYPIDNNGGGHRWASSFVIFPQSGYAGVHFNLGAKKVLLDGIAGSYEMAIDGVNTADFYYILGNNKQIYQHYKTLRNKYGYNDVYPKSQLFELGWETWDALGWNTNEKTVKETLQEFLDRGYPIRWAVTGSGFWEEGGTTTSFGKFGPKFSNAVALKKWLNDNKIAWMIGLRTNIVPAGGPYYSKRKRFDRNLKVGGFKGNPIATEGLAKGYFIKDQNGDAKKFTSGVFPVVPTYIIDGRVKGTGQWFLKQFNKWNVDGIKEDTMMRLGGNVDVFNRPISALANAKQNYLIMARCGAFSSPGTLLRINDTGGASSMQRRTPLNYMQYAACGAPNVYSDTIGFHRIRDKVSSIRLAWMQAMTAGIAVGALPKKWSVEDEAMLKKAIMFRYALTPYFYSEAVRAFNTGYPYTLTPLTIANKYDLNAKHLPNYQWMIGESILATPLLKNYKSGIMDIYLPAGKWIDYDTNKVYEGKQMLKNFEMPLGKTPVFIGGKGIITSRKSDDSAIEVSVYPVSKISNNVYEYTYMNGKDKSIIKYGKMSDVNFSKVKVVNTTKNSIVKFTVDMKKNILKFTIEPNCNYEIINN